MNAIFKRVSVREFAGEPVADEAIEKLLKAAMAAPSAGNQQPWHFIVVTSAEAREALGQASPYSKPAARAPLDIVPVMDTSAARFAGIAVQDMSAATENILLEAVELGMGAVWQALYPEEERMSAVREILSIPEDVCPFCIISIGYPAEEPREQQDRYNVTRVHHERW